MNYDPGMLVIVDGSYHPFEGSAGAGVVVWAPDGTWTEIGQRVPAEDSVHAEIQAAVVGLRKVLPYEGLVYLFTDNDAVWRLGHRRARQAYAHELYSLLRSTAGQRVEIRLITRATEAPIRRAHKHAHHLAGRARRSRLVLRAERTFPLGHPRHPYLHHAPGRQPSAQRTPPRGVWWLSGKTFQRERAQCPHGHHAGDPRGCSLCDEEREVKR